MAPTPTPFLTHNSYLTGNFIHTPIYCKKRRVDTVRKSLQKNKLTPKKNKLIRG